MTGDDRQVLEEGILLPVGTEQGKLGYFSSGYNITLFKEEILFMQVQFLNA